jgi:hypothetical protein
LLSPIDNPNSKAECILLCAEFLDLDLQQTFDPPGTITDAALGGFRAMPRPSPDDAANGQLFFQYSTVAT